MMKSLLRLVALLCGLIPAAASAHPDIGGATGFAHGFSHPFGGLDHVLAMVAIGLLAWHRGGRALWLLPLGFLAAMALGGALAMAGVELPFVEIGIGLSVVVLGLVLASRVALPTLAAMVLVAFFAVFHGYAHGAETAETMSGLAYSAGFLGATAFLHAIGIALGWGICRAATAHGHGIVRAGGAAIACAGAIILSGVL